MTSQEKEKIKGIGKRLLDVADTLLANDAENFSNQDLADLALIISNISKVLRDMAEAPHA
ncbi:MAG: hypothetical protein AB7E47_12520 [Desulfovibrionaceae bacterium]